jgi:hypothetical protein
MLAGNDTRGIPAICKRSKRSIVVVTLSWWGSFVYPKFYSAAAAPKFIIVGSANMLLKIKLSSIGSAVCTDAVKRLTASHGFFNRKGHDAWGNLGEFVALLVCLPIFQAVHFSFKIANTLDQRRLCLLCGKNFFLKLYDRGVPSGSIVDVLQSLGYIKGSLDGTETSEYFSHHSTSSIAEIGTPSMSFRGCTRLT